MFENKITFCNISIKKNLRKNFSQKIDPIFFLRRSISSTFANYRLLTLGPRLLLDWLVVGTFSTWACRRVIFILSIITRKLSYFLITGKWHWPWWLSRLPQSWQVLGSMPATSKLTSWEPKFLNVCDSTLLWRLNKYCLMTKNWHKPRLLKTPQHASWCSLIGITKNPDVFNFIIWCHNLEHLWVRSQCFQCIY